MYPVDSLKFWSQGKGHWKDCSDNDWNDWRWQMKNSIKSADGFSKYIQLSSDEIAGLNFSSNRLSVSVTPYFLNLMDPVDPNCPIRKQIIPRNAESEYLPEEIWDPVSEESSMPVSSIVHRYPDRVLFLVTDRCASYCRYCTRSRLVSNAQGYGFSPKINEGIEYIKSNKTVRDVLLSGGDPLLLSDQKLSFILDSLSKIEHVEFIRIGTRVPVFLPQRINSQLLRLLDKIDNLWMSIHVNHPKECTLDLRKATLALAKAGIPLGNQSVLMKDINDNVGVMKSLIHRLLMMKVRPYYLYQCDLIKGSSHFRTDPKVGLEIIKGLRGHTSGYAIPQFVIDSPNGGGKIPLSPNYANFLDDGSIYLKNYSGKTCHYPSVEEKHSFIMD